MLNFWQIVGYQFFGNSLGNLAMYLCHFAFEKIRSNRVDWKAN